MNTHDPQGLPTNQVGHSIQAIGHRLEQHATKIVAGICVILVVAAAGIWWSRQSNATATTAWTLLESATTVDHFAAVADTYKGTLPGRWARLREAESYLQAGMSRMFSDREFALGQLKKATERFEQLADDKAVGPAILERTLWGLAVATEATNSGDTGKAIDAYQRLLDAIQDTFYKQIAEQRIAALKTGGAKEFYAWFSKQMPKPEESRPNDGASSDLESLLPSPGKSEFNHDSIMKPADPKDDPAKETPAKPESNPQDPPADAASPEAKPEPKPESDAKSDPARPETKPAEKPEANPTAKPDDPDKE